MKFVEVIKNKKFSLFSVFLFLYLILNLLDGERGLLSYFEKQKKIDLLLKEKKILVAKLSLIEKQNNLLTGVIDKDYLEILLRKKFMIGKDSEKVYIK
jgi:cell division protein FtsB